jgi:hypothetical protein
MATVDGDWLTKGYFVLHDDGLMRDVRDILERSLRMPKGTLHVRMYPEEQKWKHTVWWREGRDAYKEAQFFAQIARGYPVLSLGVAIEKGYKSIKTAKSPAKRMDRSWDWHRLVANAGSVLGPDIRSLGRRLQRPVTVRVNVSGDASNAAYTFAGGNWYERYEGHGAKWRVVEHLKDVDGMDDQWAIVHLACDLSPAEAHGLTGRDLASALIKFNEIRQRLRGGAT